MRTVVPLRRPAGSSDDLGAGRPPPSLGRGRLLIIDDDEDDAFLIQELLSESCLCDFEIDVRTTFDATIAAIEAVRYDAILLDFRLGAHDGLDVLRATRGLSSRPPVIVLTGDGSRTVDVAVMEAGAAGFINKSELTIVALERALRYALREAAQREQLEALANRDALTGLPNRGGIEARIDEAARRARRTGHMLAVAMIDLDGFKAVNDTLGHAQGDDLLREVGDALRRAARSHDLVGRLGGDEFVVVLEDVVETADIEVAAQRFVESVARRCQRVVPLPVSASLGLALYPRDVSESADLLPSADVAMYAAKRNGKARFEVFAPSAAGPEPARIDLDVLDAIARGEVSAAFQPQIDLVTGEIVGFEALARWTREDGPVSPALFVPALERSGTIAELDLWILEHALRWRAADPRRAGLRIAVNLSPVDLADRGFLGRFEAALRHSDGGPVEIELTENALMPQNGDPRAALAALSRLGVSLALDDFGVGFSSFGRLRQLPVDKIKIDRSFVDQMLVSAADRAIVEGMISMAKSLGLSVVAEGIESADQAKALTALGVPYGQGYWFGRPMAPEDFDAWRASLDDGARAAQR